MVALTAGCKKDDAGGFLADCDVTPPLAGSISPTCGATQVAINQAVNVTFSESIEPSSLNSETFWLMGPGEVPVPGSVAYSASTNIASFTPTNNLAPFTTYTYTLQGGMSGIEDLFTNALANNFTCSFTTGGVLDNTPPTVTATVPLNNAIDVPLNSVVTATFSESMDPLTISSSTFLVTGPGGAVVPGSITYAGSSFTAVFTPTGNLTPSTTYTATVTTGSEDLSGNALASDYVWSFVTGAAQDLTAPRVIATDPVDNAIDVALDKTLTATFSEVMDPTTITSYSFTLRQGGTAIPGTVSYSGTVATFNPTVDLIPNTVYTARVTTDAKDLAGNPLAENHVWVFTTPIVQDLTAPRVLSTDPANNATGVALNKMVIATFSESMDPLTINSSTFTVHNGSAQISGTVTYAGPTLAAIFNPTSDFAPNTTYTGRITTGAKDPAGNGIAADYVWVFTTGAAQDVAAPFVVSTDPAANENGVAINKSVTATFSEAMNLASISSATYTLRQGATPVVGVVSYSGTTATFNPTVDFAPNTTYTGRITTGAEDLSGNGLAADYVWSFTTAATPDLTAPTVVSTDPANLETGVLLNKSATATFSEAMNQATISSSTFTLRRGTTTVPGSVSYTGTTATFNPTADFLPNTVYTGRISTGAQDLAGNGLAADYVWTFTTAALLDLIPPIVVSTDPADLETGVDLGKSVTATFNEAMNQSTLTASTFTLRRGASTVLGSVSYSGMTATFNPSSDFAPNTTYTGRITTGAQDLAGNGLVTDFVWTFTTAAALDVVPPTVVLTDPDNNENGVAVGKSVTAQFSEAMNPMTISSSTFTLSEGLNPVSGSVSYLGTTATFNPTADFQLNTTYTGRITTGAQDLAGNGLVSDYVWTFTTGSPVVGILAVDLTCAEGFATLAGSTITSTGPSIVNGDVGLSPGSALIGFPPGIINGVTHVNDPIAANAKGCLTAAYNDAAGRAPGTSVAGNIGGLTLTPGVYTSNSTLAISGGNLTLDAQGDANGVFIFQIASSFTMTAGRQVILAGGAQAKNIFWQVGTSATIGTTAIMMGVILADQSITLETGATLNGSALTRIAAVSLDSSTVTAQ